MRIFYLFVSDLCRKSLQDDPVRNIFIFIFDNSKEYQVFYNEGYLLSKFIGLKGRVGG